LIWPCGFDTQVPPSCVCWRSRSIEVSVVISMALRSALARGSQPAGSLSAVKDDACNASTLRYFGRCRQSENARCGSVIAIEGLRDVAQVPVL